MKRYKDNSEAVDAFLAKKAEIDTMLTRLAALSADHFNATPRRSTGATSATSNSMRAS